jgi:hypothetical protein
MDDKKCFIAGEPVEILKAANKEKTIIDTSSDSVATLTVVKGSVTATINPSLKNEDA